MARRPSCRSLNVATCQFAETFDAPHNAALICRRIARAASAGANVVHFHECALSGYGGPVGEESYNWQALREATRTVMHAARTHRVHVVVGTSHKLTGPHKPHNSVYVISPAGDIIDRYDKRFCTSGDLETYSPGDHFVTFTVKGVKLGVLICYDFRFPELYRQLYTMGVRVMLHSFHNVSDGPGVLSHVARPTLQGYAGINAMWISAANSSRRYCMWPGTFITPDGLIANSLRRHQGSLMINTVDPHKTYYDASARYRDSCIRGTLHSGRVVRDARSKDRTCL